MNELSTAPEASPSRDPVASFLADPNSHLGDVLYLNFRRYKREQVWRFFNRAVAGLAPNARRGLTLADVGASMGFDFHYVLNRATQGFAQPPAWEETDVHLIEGNAQEIAAGEREWALIAGKVGIAHRYWTADLARGLPLAAASCDVLLCSEVVEHLERPENLFQEIARVLKPGGFLILTTDNSPSALQWLRRIPAWLTGAYRRRYARPDKNQEICGTVAVDGASAPIYGHINLNPTRYWERLASDAGLVVASYGTYESIRRGGGGKSPAAMAGYFLAGFLVWLLPARLGRFFGDTTALLLRKSSGLSSETPA